MKTARRTFWFMERMRWFQFIATLSLQVGMIAYAARLWMDRRISVGSFAMVASMLLLVINDVRNLSRRFLEFFEYVGNVTDGVGIIIRPHEIIDDPAHPTWSSVVAKFALRMSTLPIPAAWRSSAASI